MIKKLLTLSLLFVTSQSFSMHYAEENLLIKSLQVLKADDSRKTEIQAVLNKEQPFTDLSPELLVFLMRTISPTLPLDKAVENFLTKNLKRLIAKTSTYKNEYKRIEQKRNQLHATGAQYDLDGMYVSSSYTPPTEAVLAERERCYTYKTEIQEKFEKNNAIIAKVEQILLNTIPLSDLTPEDLA